MPDADDAALALWTVGAGRAEIRQGSAPAPGPDQLRLRALVSGISRGTEALVFAGQGARERMGPHALSLPGGRFSLPGEIWLFHGGAGRGWAGGAHGTACLLPASPSDPHDPAGQRRDPRAGRCADGTRGARRADGDGAERAVGCRPSPGRPHRRGGGGEHRLPHRLSGRRHKGGIGDADRSRRVSPRRGGRPRRRLRHARRRFACGTATSSSMPRAMAPASISRCPSPASRPA